MARLVADADHRDAEYAILVADEWQGRGLGTLMTDYCIELCDSWGMDRVYAETTVDNGRMQNILRRHKFRQKKSVDGEVLYESLLKQSANRFTPEETHSNHRVRSTVTWLSIRLTPSKSLSIVCSTCLR